MKIKQSKQMTMQYGEDGTYDHAATCKTLERELIERNAKKAHQKHASNYAPPKRRNRKK